MFVEWLTREDIFLPNYAWILIALVVVALIVTIAILTVRSLRHPEEDAHDVEDALPEATPESTPEEVKPAAQEEIVTAEPKTTKEDKEEAPVNNTKENKSATAAKTTATAAAKPAAKTEKPATKTYHISKRKEDGKWQVKAEKAAKAIKLFDTQAQAIEYCKTLAENQDANIMIHKVDGSFRKLTY